MYQVRIYNAVNHNIDLYQNPAAYSVNRRGQYFLTNPAAKPDKIIYQQKPLSVTTTLTPTNPKVSPGLFLPEVIGAQLETLADYYNYDIIVVSNIYAGLARQMVGNSLDLDYTDRLFTPVPVFGDNPQFYANAAQKVGSVGFRKVWYPRTPQEYVMEFRAGRLPSVSAVKVCLDIYNSHRAYCDQNTAAWLMELRNWLPAEMEKHAISA